MMARMMTREQCFAPRIHFFSVRLPTRTTSMHISRTKHAHRTITERADAAIHPTRTTRRPRSATKGAMMLQATHRRRAIHCATPAAIARCTDALVTSYAREAGRSTKRVAMSVVVAHSISSQTSQKCLN